MRLPRETVVFAAAGGALVLILTVSATSGQTEDKSESRRMPRMYEGAPPFVPHDVEIRKGLCQECHTTGEQGAPITPHPTRTHFCIACHVSQDQSVPLFDRPQRAARPRG
jgi:nitrate reductase cytochrome c-type subunit